MTDEKVLKEADRRIDAVLAIVRPYAVEDDLDEFMAGNTTTIHFEKMPFGDFRIRCSVLPEERHSPFGRAPTWRDVYEMGAEGWLIHGHMWLDQDIHSARFFITGLSIPVATLDDVGEYLCLAACADDLGLIEEDGQKYLDMSWD